METSRVSAAQNVPRSDPRMNLTFYWICSNPVEIHTDGTQGFTNQCHVLATIMKYMFSTDLLQLHLIEKPWDDFTFHLSLHCQRAAMLDQRLVLSNKTAKM